MNAKILLIAFSAVAFSSCSTAYKSGQTPDDVYYSPVRPVVEVQKENNRYRDEVRQDQYTADYYRLRMTIRDRRWRDFDDYDYSYNNSPYYYYCGSYHNNYGYYYNPYYYFQPVYYPTVRPTPVNTTPRMANLRSYRNYNNAVVNSPKLGNSSNTVSTRQYNNSNNGSRTGNILRQALTPAQNNNYNNNTNTNNNTRTYTPPTNSNNSSSTPASPGGGSGGGGTPVARPGRG